eukprot:8889805-Pyramimonas_sp.AAC.1
MDARAMASGCRGAALWTRDPTGAFRRGAATQRRSAAAGARLGSPGREAVAVHTSGGEKHTHTHTRLIVDSPE